MKKCLRKTNGGFPGSFPLPCHFQEASNLEDNDSNCKYRKPKVSKLNDGNHSDNDCKSEFAYCRDCNVRERRKVQLLIMLFRIRCLA